LTQQVKAQESGLSITQQVVLELQRRNRRENLGRAWYKFSRNPLSIIGASTVLVVTLLAVFAPLVTPYPEHVKPFVDFDNASLPPSLAHLFGTDEIGRDILSRVIFGFREALGMGVVVLTLVVPVGVLMGLVAGYFHGTWIDTVIMRLTDIFLAVPPLVLALAIASVLKPNLFNAMMAVSLMWWPWYARLVYGLTSALRNEFFVPRRRPAAQAPAISSPRAANSLTHLHQDELTWAGSSSSIHVELRRIGCSTTDLAWGPWSPAAPSSAGPVDLGLPGLAIGRRLGQLAGRRPRDLFAAEELTVAASLRCWISLTGVHFPVYGGSKGADGVNFQSTPAEGWPGGRDGLAIHHQKAILRILQFRRRSRTGDPIKRRHLKMKPTGWARCAAAASR
jgi:ABC-type antimicrobial peptide transport system permease subunit